MTERSFRSALGVWLVAALYFDLPLAIAAMVGLLLFEGITNWRVPLLVSKVRQIEAPPCHHGAAVPLRHVERVPFDAERALRLLIAALALLSVFVFPQALWFLGWFVAFALIGSGLSGMCPMVMALRVVGFR